MKVSAEAKRLARREKKLFEQGQISICNSAENIQALFDIVESRRDNIKKSMQILMAR
jgi:hypothetical protein